MSVGCRPAIDLLLITVIGIVAETDISPLTYMTTSVDREIVLPLLCSLLNTVCIARLDIRLPLL